MTETKKLVFYLCEASMGCLMANLSMADSLAVREWVEKNVLPENLASDGYEACPHVTVLYGFLPTVSINDISQVCRETLDKVDLKLGRVTRFENDTDVLKVDVFSDDLTKLHYALRQKFQDDVEITHPDYKPHVTLAYLKKGAHPELTHHAQFEGNVYRIKELVYSEPESKNKVTINLQDDDGPVESLRLPELV